MALPPNTWYTSSAGWTAVSAWTNGHAYTAGTLVRQLAAPTVGNERVWACITAGTSGGSEPSPWTFTKGSKTTDNTVTWIEVTGQPTVNGDLSTASQPAWVASTAISQGNIINDTVSGALQVCTTAGTTKSGSPPAFSATAGTPTSDNSVTWTSLGANTNFQYWKAPHARLANAYVSTWGAAGNNFYLADNSAETQATAMTLTSPSSATVACYTLCIDHTANLPPVAGNINTGATISTTGASNITIQGLCHEYEGIGFLAGDSSNTGNILLQNAVGMQRYKSCAFTLNNTSASSIFRALSGRVDMVNSTATFGATGQSFQINAPLRWTATPSAIGGATFPTTLFIPLTSTGAVYCSGLDLSALGSGKSLVGLASTGPPDIIIQNCKINASATLTTGTAANQGSVNLWVVNCDSAATNYLYTKVWRNLGTISQEIVVVKSGGSSDGTTPFSRKAVTTANSKFFAPLESDPIPVWIDSTGSHTITTNVITDNVTLTTADAWIEIEYLGSSSTPISSFGNCAAATILTAGSNQPTDGTSSWTTTGIGTPIKQNLAVTFTSNLKGPAVVRVYLAKASTTMWFDCNPVVT